MVRTKMIDGREQPDVDTFWIKTLDADGVPHFFKLVDGKWIPQTEEEVNPKRLLTETHPIPAKATSK